jgi:pentose-5-phosphate-3-epimerase
MQTARQRFYGRSALSSFPLPDVLDGHVIKINPALITLIDGRVDTTPPATLQRSVQDHVIRLVSHKIHTFHVDVNYPDYRGYGPQPPAINTQVFTPAFLQDLNALIRSKGGFLNLHLLTDSPLKQLRHYDHIALGAVCFQLEVLPDMEQLVALIDHILGMGACASPVIETVGSDHVAPPSPQRVLQQLQPVLARIGMLTFQAAGTASRSNQPAGTFAADQVRRFIAPFKQAFRGTVQIQGGIKIETVGQALELGAEFLVIGTQLFHHPDGLSSTDVVDRLLRQAAIVLNRPLSGVR